MALPIKGCSLTCAVALFLMLLSTTTHCTTSIRRAISAERRMAASLIRLHFHDCFVQGCDASILLEDSASIKSEVNAGQNKDSVRGFDVIENAKKEVESICPGIVSCADILAVASRDASVAVTLVDVAAPPMLAPLDLVTPNQLDNNYFKNLIQKKSLLQSDQILYSGAPTKDIVTEYSKSRSTFSSDFASAMVKMGDIEPLNGSAGGIRKICKVVN
ncbi:Lignin-forming anionic peroxidase [Morus notabilis]|uniref:peroxidase n=1 Tax=Morus notabilis TaxID=981085 RepID=W9QN42_9ROSA|nr:Lignin-forming anionic peroxidase [Morus notabilis]